MSRQTPVLPGDARGYAQLIIDATLGLTGVIETMHHNIARTPRPLGAGTEAPAPGLTGFVYRNIRGFTRLVGSGVDGALGLIAPAGDFLAPSPTREAVVATVNGVLGDHLAASGNPLAIAMAWRRGGATLVVKRDALAQAIPAAGSRILVAVHGLCMHAGQWCRKGHDHAAALAAEAGFTPVYLNYNSGRHISINGRELADQLETLVRNWPLAVEELVILGHSMGGLLARSALHYGVLAGHQWPGLLRRLFFLGTPHQGAPLERGGNWIDAILGVSPYTMALARLGKIRSAGITDLRHGSLLDADWQHRDRFAPGAEGHAPVPLPLDVACYAVAASLAQPNSPVRDRFVGDGLVPLPSALGRHRHPDRRLDFPRARQAVFYGLNHLDLLDHPAVYAQLQRWLATPV